MTSRSPSHGSLWIYSRRREAILSGSIWALSLFLAWMASWAEHSRFISASNHPRASDCQGAFYCFRSNLRRGRGEKKDSSSNYIWFTLSHTRDDQGRCFQASELEQEFKWRRQKTRSFQNVACSLMKANCSLTLTRSHLFVLRNLSRVKLGVFLSTVSHRFMRSASEAYLELTSNRPASSLDGLFQNLVKQNRPIMTHKWKARNDLSLRSNGISGKVTVWRERERRRSEQ